MSAKIHLTDSEVGSNVAVASKERGRSLLLNSKPKYMTSKKAQVENTTQVPLPEVEEAPKKEPKPTEVVSEPTPVPEVPALSLDAQLKMKVDAEREEARLKKEVRHLSLAPPVPPPSPTPLSHR